MTTRGIDPRVARTRATVLRTTLELLATSGPTGMSLTKLAASAGVSRQTIYTHWGTPTQLIAEAILEGFVGGYPEAAPTITETLRGWLTSLRDANSEPQRAVAIVTIAAHAFHDRTSADALQHIVLDRHAALNTVLAPFGVELSVEHLAVLNGPVLFSLFFLRNAVADQLIDSVVTQTEPLLTRHGP